MGCDASTSFHQASFSQCEHAVLLEPIGNAEGIQARKHHLLQVCGHGQDLVNAHSALVAIHAIRTANRRVPVLMGHFAFAMRAEFSHQSLRTNQNHTTGHIEISDTQLAKTGECRWCIVGVQG